jgi:hypothetical protein
MHKLFVERFVLTIIIISLSIGCLPGRAVAASNQHHTDALVATAWMQLYLYLIQQTEGFTPPVAARALGYAGVTLYEAVVPGLSGYQSLVGQLNGLSALPQPVPDQAYHWLSVANRAMAALAHELFINTTRDNEVLIEKGKPLPEAVE